MAGLPSHDDGEGNVDPVAAIAAIASSDFVAAIPLSNGKKNPQLWVGLALGVVVAYRIAEHARPVFEIWFKSRWIADRAAFESSQDGFPMLRRVAHDEFGLDLELASYDTGYAISTHLGPQSSRGVMTLFPGYCEVSIWPEGVAKGFVPLRGDFQNSKEQRVMGAWASAAKVTQTWPRARKASFTYDAPDGRERQLLRQHQHERLEQQSEAGQSPCEVGLDQARRAEPLGSFTHGVRTCRWHSCWKKFKCQ